MTDVFAAIGAFATFAVAAILLVLMVWALILAIKDWLIAKSEIVRATENLTKTQAMLMRANNELNERLKALEGEVRDD